MSRGDACRRTRHDMLAHRAEASKIENRYFSLYAETEKAKAGGRGIGDDYSVKTYRTIDDKASGPAINSRCDID